MAWGYGSDDVGIGLFLSLVLQGGLLLWLLSSGYRRFAADCSAWILALGGAGVIAALAGLDKASGHGITAGFLILFVVIPLSFLNSALLAFRGWPSRPPHTTRWPLLLPLLLDLLFWSWRVFGPLQD